MVLTAGGLALLAAVIVAAAVMRGGTAAPADARDVVRVGVLQFGTVNWELDVIQHHGLDAKEGVKVEPVVLASKNATAVALQGGAVDVIVTDWIWVTRQRSNGIDYTFAPHSVIAGGVIVRPDSGIRSLDDLRGKKIGVAGGPVDKSWLLLRAYALKTIGVDLATVAEPVYGAPPLLNELMLKGELPAVLTFWNYEARLKAKGMKQVIAIRDVLRSFGGSRDVPVVGWVFSEKWAKTHEAAINGFLRASAAAKKILATSDEEWERIRPLTDAEDETTLVSLRDAYRSGIPTGDNDAEAKAAQAIFSVLAKTGGKDLAGDSTEIEPGTFWNGTAH
ncbi:MAG: ABC transporter substrate-binding protein [Alphaproteobacteria bacterium]